MNQLKVKGETASVAEFIVGTLCILIGFNNFRFGFWNALAWIMFGLFLVANGLEWRTLLREYRTYSTLLSNDSNKSIAKLSQATNNSEKTVRENLNLMIKKGMAVNTVINEQDGTVITNIAQGAGIDSPAASFSSLQASVPDNITVTCSGCGATNQIAKGSVVNCEHCGAPLSV